MSNVTVNKDLANKTLTIERSFQAPKEKLWKAYADKEWFEAWWGPEGWQTTTKEHNFTSGGRIHYGMKCVDENQGEWFGQESWGIMDIEQVDEPNSFSAKDYFSNPEGEINNQMPGSQFKVEFIEDGDHTKLVCHSMTQTEEQLEELVKMGMVEGFSSQLNKLEALLAR